MTTSVQLRKQARQSLSVHCFLIVFSFLLIVQREYCKRMLWTSRLATHQLNAFETEPCKAAFIMSLKVGNLVSGSVYSFQMAQNQTFLTYHHFFSRCNQLSLPLSTSTYCFKCSKLKPFSFGYNYFPLGRLQDSLIYPLTTINFYRSGVV